MGHASQSPLRIVIVGGGTAGWMAASLMAKRWADRDLQISVIESADVGIIGVGEGSTPQLRAFFDILGVSEGEWMPRCNATYKTAIESVGWSTRPGYERYYHPFKTDLDDRSAPAYYFHTLLRRHDADVPAHPDRYLLNTRLAQQGRGPHPVHQFPFRSFYGYHFDATLIGRFLREWSTARGVRHLIATVAQINLTESGNILSLSCSDGQEIEADFFVDSTGFRSLLLQQALGVRFVPFASNLYNDAAVAVPTEHAQPDFAPQTTGKELAAPKSEEPLEGHRHDQQADDSDHSHDSTTLTQQHQDIDIASAQFGGDGGRRIRAIAGRFCRQSLQFGRTNSSVRRAVANLLSQANGWSAARDQHE